MDVRCEKCRTEYELDESKLKPGGVTVKCTSCGHMFKVRRRITAVGPAVSGPPTLQNVSSKPPAKTATANANESIPASGEPEGKTTSLATDEGRTWLIRLGDGEILTCRELSTLQKWIVAGRVNRVCQISRSGKKWKPLGEIGELASFFMIADEAREAAGKAPVPAKTLMGHPNVVPRVPTGPASAAAPSAPPSPPAMPAVSPPAASKPPVIEPPVVQPPPQPALGQTSKGHAASGPGRVPPKSAAPRPEGRTTGEWASKQAEAGRDGRNAGPSRGVPRASSQADVHFAGLSARIGDRKGEFENGAFVPTDDIDMPPRGSGRWIAIFSVLIILGGLAVLYFVVLRERARKPRRRCRSMLPSRRSPPMRPSPSRSISKTFCRRREGT